MILVEIKKSHESYAFLEYWKTIIIYDLNNKAQLLIKGYE